jgi:asparagine synthase (glutamine-hydrolysing)
MGAVSFLIYNMTKPPINIDFSKSFVKMKRRGQDDTQVITESSPIITNFNISQISNYLSKREISEYRPFTFQYGYHRLSINDISLDGSQPFEDPILHKLLKYPELRTRPKRKLLCNGEIYNYNKLIEHNGFNDKDLQSNSDTEIILPLYIKNTHKLGDSRLGLEECLKNLNGDYSFILTENVTSFNLKEINIFAVRDILGTKPLYMVKYVPKSINSNPNDIFYMFVSEIKGIPLNLLNDPEYIITEIPPGTYWSYKNSIIDKNQDEFVKYYNFDKYKDLTACTINKADPETISKLYNNIQEILTKSIIDRYELCEHSHKVGLLLSGGFDSCIITSILVKYLVEKYNYSHPLHVFTIGTNTNTDVINAKQHVELLETTYNIDIQHHIINIDDFNLITDEIDNIIIQLETFDRINIQKSIPMSFLLKYIKLHTDVKVLLSGEGLDELCGHYQLFSLNDTQFQEKSIQLLQNLSKFDLLRNDKLAGSYGLEIRYPFLDTCFIEYILSIHPSLKRPQISGYSKNPIEKYIIRKSFDTANHIIIDKNILWNHKQDIRYSLENLKQQLTNFYNDKYNDLDLFNYLQTTDINNIIPNTKEEMHYKKIFDMYYPNTSNILSCYWKSLWDNTNN